MGKDRQNIFWIKTGETFDGKTVGEDITDYFYDDKDNPIQVERLKKLKNSGCVSTEEPDNPEIASEQELNQLRATVKDQAEKIADLENDLAGVPKNVTAAKKKLKIAEAKVKDLEAAGDTVAANAKIEDLEGQITDKDIEIENLGVQVTELTATIETQKGEIEALTDPKKSGDKS